MEYIFIVVKLGLIFFGSNSFSLTQTYELQYRLQRSAYSLHCPDDKENTKNEEAVGICGDLILPQRENILKERVKFSENTCDANSKGNSECEESEKCIKLLRFEEGRFEKGLLSILLWPECQKGRRMKLFSWRNFAITLYCESEERSLLNVLIGKVSFEYIVTENNSYLHILLKLNCSDTSINCMPLLYANGSLVHPQSFTLVSKKQTLLTFWNTISFGQHNEDGMLSEPFIGKIISADYISGDLADEDLNMEVEYMSLLAKDAKQPECLCNSKCRLHENAKSCPDGKDRLERFLVSSPKYRLCPNYKENITLVLKQTAVIKKIEISVTKTLKLDIYADFRNKSRFLGHIGIDKEGTIVWNSSEDKYVRRLSLVFDRVPKKGDDSQVITDIKVYGEYLNGQIDLCFCFPGNGNGTLKNVEKCGKCRQCICRDNYNNKALAGKTCKPYITRIEPRFGPRSGGSKLTMFGGLLNPTTSTREHAIILLGHQNLCTDITIEDDIITCVLVEAANDDRVDMERQVKVRLVIENTYHFVEEEYITFTYKPCPYITMEEVEWIPNGGLSIILFWKHYESVDWGAATLQMEMLHFEQNLTSTNCSQVMDGICCNFPDVKRNISGNATVNFHYDKSEVFTRDIQIKAFVYVQTSLKNEKDDETDLLTSIFVGLTIVLIFGFCIIGILLYIKKIPKRQRHGESEGHQMLTFQGNVYYFAALHCTDQIHNNLFLELDDIVIGEEITRGCNGRVLQGTLRSGRSTRRITLKTLNNYSSVDRSQIGEFLEEATILRKFNHVNVLSLIGIVVEGWELYVVLPYMEHGDLHSYIIHIEFEVGRFTQLALDVARGMAYLSDNGFIHRDLATRNCQVNGDGRAVIADFGLASDIFKDDYEENSRRRLQPFKWMAPESLETRTFTTESDVWSFGVLVWEIFSKGAKPYPEVENSVMRDYLKSGRRLRITPGCPNTMYQLMKKCWRAEPDQRPKFHYLMDEIEDFSFNYLSTSPSTSSAFEIDPEQDTEVAGFTKELGATCSNY